MTSLCINANNMETLDKMPFTDKNPAFVDLIDLATYDKMTEDEQIAYDRSLKRMWDYDAGLWSAKQEGHEEGKAEERVAIAVKFKNLGVAIDTISQATGLSKEEIEKL